MEKMIVIIDLHCDGLLPPGYSSSGGGNKYSRNILALLIAKNIPFIYFTEKTDSNLESFIQLASRSFLYRIDMTNIDCEKGTIKYKEKIVSYIEPILTDYIQYTFIFHSIYWYSGEIAEYFSTKYDTYFIHTVVSNEKTKINLGVADKNASKRCEIEQFIFEQAKYIICSSESESKDIENYYNINKSKLKVTGRIIEEEFLIPYLDLYENPRTVCFSNKMTHCYVNNPFPYQVDEKLPDWTRLKVFLYVGRIHKNKGIVQIILAWEQLYHKYGMSTPPLWIVGGTPQEIFSFKKDYIRDIFLLNEIEKNFKLTWWGTLSPESISALMCKSLVLVTHSKYEAGGNTILEAMAHALPVIATPYGYAKDYIRHNENGYLVQYNDIDALKQYMEYFIKQPYLTNYMGRVAARDIHAIMHQWQFKEQHMQMYGLYIKNDNAVRNIPFIPKDSIDTYFNRFILPEETFICDIIHAKTGHTTDHILGKGNLHNYYLWEISVAGNIYYFYFLYSILNRSCLEKVCKDYVITKYQRTEYFAQECQREGITIYFLDKSEGYAYISNRIRKIL